MTSFPKENPLPLNLSHANWRHIHRRTRTPFYQFLLFEGASKHYNKKIKFPYEVNLLYLDKELYGDEKRWQTLQLKSLLAFKKDPNFLLRIARDSYILNCALEKEAKKIGKMDYEKITLFQLLKEFNKYLELTLLYGYCILIPLFAEEALEKSLKSLIREKFKTDEEKTFQVLSAPAKPGVVYQEEISLLRMAVKKEKGMNISKDVEKHLKKFSWLKNNSFDGTFSTAGEIMAKLKNYVNPDEKLNGLAAKSKAYRAEFKKYQRAFLNDKKALHLIETVRELIYFRSWRTERYYRNAYYLQPLFKKMSRLIGLKNEKDIFYLTPFEIKDLLSIGKRADLRIIDDRKKGYLLFSDQRTNILLCGKAMKDIKKGFSVQKALAQKYLCGQVAYPGKVQGAARVIVNKHELKNIKPGEILVTSSTTPDYVPYLKRVKAIITEEGGILCHASVISRELHIPCIIGAKGITKFFKDGDTIEVDATKGIISVC